MRGVADTADELPHHAQTAAPRDRAAGRRQITSNDLQQRGLAGAIGPNEGDRGAFTDAEGHIVGHVKRDPEYDAIAYFAATPSPRTPLPNRQLPRPAPP